MTHRPFLLAFMALVSFGISAQPEAPSTEEEIALGWRFADCAHYFVFAGEAAKAAGNLKASEGLVRVQHASFAAAVALVGEERYKAEVPARRQDFIKKLKTPPLAESIDKTDAECLMLVRTKLESVVPKIQAHTAKTQAEKTK